MLLVIVLSVGVHHVCSSSVSSLSEKLSKELYVNLITDTIESGWNNSAASTDNKRMHNVAIPGLVLMKPTIVDGGVLRVFGEPVVHLRDYPSVDIKVFAVLKNRKVTYAYTLDGGATGTFTVANGDRKYKMFFKSDDYGAIQLASMILVNEDPIVVDAQGPSSAEALELSKAVEHWLTLESRASAYHSINDSFL